MQGSSQGPLAAALGAARAGSERARAVVASVFAIAEWAEYNRARPYAEELFGADPSGLRKVAQVGTIVTVVAIALVAIIGILIYDEVFSALPEDTLELNTDPGNRSADALGNQTEDVTTGFGDAIGLVPVILIVLLASLVIGVVQTLRG